MDERTPPVASSLGFGLTSRTRKPRIARNNASAIPVRRARILVVDGDRASSNLIVARLSAENYDVEPVGGAQHAIEAYSRFQPNLVITRLRMEPVDGIGLLKELKSRSAQLSVIILTAHGTIPEAVYATQCGAFGFLVRPIDRAELLGQVRRAIAASSFNEGMEDWRARIVSRSRLMEDRLHLANKAAHSDAPVLLSGQGGTGKELFARAIHAASPRRGRAFVPFSCRTAHEESLGRELFGANADQGALAAARGGTLMLSEIGDLPLPLQANLARRMQASESVSRRRPGTMQTDARLICTTSHDLKERIEIGQFDRELYHQINILPIDVPPLGRRREDIPLLVSRFLKEARDSSGLTRIYSPKAVELLATTDWPGNVRQLFDFVRQNVAESRGPLMTDEFVQHALGCDSKQLPSYDEARDGFSRDYLIRSLRTTGGNISQSARLAKRNRTDFYRLLSQHCVLSGDFKEDGRHGVK
jgi:two-component system, NtrC family, response regulator GlrR